MTAGPIKKRVLVLGVTGYIGRHFVPCLLSQGYSVIAAARTPQALSNEKWYNHPKLILHRVDLAKPETLTSILDNTELVFYLVHGMMAGKQFFDYELRLANNFTRALTASPGKRVVYLGALQPASTESQHLLARKATGDILRQSGCQVIELRSGVIIGPGSAAFEVMRDMVYHLPVMTTPKWVRSLSAPVALADLLYYLEHFINHPVEGNPIYDVGGSEAISYEEQMRRFARIIRKPLLILKLPFLTPAISSYWLHLVTSVPAPVASALVKGLAHDLLPRQEYDISNAIPRQRINFDDAVRTTLAEENKLLDNEIWQYDADAVSRWRPGFSYYPKQAGYTLRTGKSASALWSTLTKIGGNNGYFYANPLWKVRAWLDQIFGGKGLISKRPDHNQLQPGDYIDSWKVLSVKKNTHLSLLFGMKAPGLGRLEFSITDKGDYRLLDIRAWWHPAGLWGLLYWFAMLPAHLFIFKGMAKAISTRS
ncbi:SDR family oxidoreductase [Endozoicomonas sp. Mp262]|uniref:SDR family oxidoreductase n=1 Tax=Endozoicomonas sp. Mp262 TaxID=2919499 RepID=UPI0021DFB5CE